MQARPSVVLTRDPADSRALCEALVRRGVPVVEIPCVSGRLVDPAEAEVAALPAAEVTGAVAFTSRRGAEGWARWPGRIAAAGVPVAAIGDSTARALEEAGIRPSMVADPPTGAALAVLLASRLAPPGNVILPGGDLRAGGLEEGLAAAGIAFFHLTVYVNEEPPITPLDPFPVAAIFVASPSAARRLVSAMPWMLGERFLAIGETTAAAIRDLGAARVEVAGRDLASWEAALVAMIPTG